MVTALEARFMQPFDTGLEQESGPSKSPRPGSSSATTHSAISTSQRTLLWPNYWEEWVLCHEHGWCHWCDTWISETRLHHLTPRLASVDLFIHIHSCLHLETWMSIFNRQGIPESEIKHSSHGHACVSLMLTVKSAKCRKKIGLPPGRVNWLTVPSKFLH